MTAVGNYLIEVWADNLLVGTWNTNIVSCPHEVYGDWTVTKEPTCTQTGEREHTCENCGHIAKETIPALGHEFTTSVIVEPTCVRAGYTEHCCERCDYVRQDNFVPAIGHDYGAWVTIEATAETVRQVRYCAHECGIPDYRELPPYLHQITISSTASDNLRLAVSIYDKRQEMYTMQDFINYLNNNGDFTASGTVRYYDPATQNWYNTTVTRVVKVDSRSFAYYYLKNGIEIKVVTTLSWLEISDVISLWATVATA